MAKLGKIKKGSEPVYPRVGENRTPITAGDLNKLIGKLTASSITVKEVTTPFPFPDDNNELQEVGGEYDPLVLDANFSTVAQVLNNLIDIVQDAGLVNEFDSGPDTVAFSAWIPCDELGGNVFLNEVDTVNLLTILGENEVFAIDVEGGGQRKWSENPSPPVGKSTNYTWAELVAENITLYPDCE